MYDVIIRDGTIVRSSGRLVADIAIQDGKIAYVGGNPGGPAKEEISAIGRFVMPGVIDAHVHFRDPGDAAKESWATGSQEALRGGVTTVLDMPTTEPPTLCMDTVQAKLERAPGGSLVNYGVWAGASASNTADLGELWASGKVCGTMVYMGESSGPFGITAAQLEEVFQSPRACSACTPKIGRPSRPRRSAHEASTTRSTTTCGPPAASVKAVETLIDLVQRTQRPVHICHLSTAGELAVLDPYRGDLPITSEVSASPLLPEHRQRRRPRQLGEDRPSCTPELDRRAMVAALKRGRLDTFGSNHAPHTLAEKQQDYWSTPSGLPTVGTMFPLILGALKNGRIGLEMMVSMCSETPARIFNLEGKGRIEEGADADLIMFRDGVTTKLTKDIW